MLAVGRQCGLEVKTSGSAATLPRSDYPAEYLLVSHLPLSK